MTPIRPKNICLLWMFAICVLSGCGGGGGGGGVKIMPATSVSFSPSSGPVGTLVTVTGTDFSTTQSVSIGGVAAVPITESSSQLVALVMPGAASGPVTGSTASGDFASSNNFTITATGVPANQQGGKLVGTGDAMQGWSVALSADGNTALVGGRGASWVFTRSNNVWTQQGDALMGSGTVGVSWQGASVALSADGNTALIGDPCDNSPVDAPCNIAPIGATWVFTRSNGIWTQQGDKLVAADAAGSAEQGWSVALSADGNTALIGGPADNDAVGATWVFTRSNDAWTQQGDKLVGTGIAGGFSGQGTSVALSADGNTAVVGGPEDNTSTLNFTSIGATWVFTRSNGMWSQQGDKLVGTGSSGAPQQGSSVAVSADGNTVLSGGYVDGFGNTYEVGATWVFTRSNDAWTQQGDKLVGAGYSGPPVGQGYSTALSADGNTAFIGGRYDDPFIPTDAGIGAAWVFTRSNGAWTQSGEKLVGNPYVGNPNQGISVAISADGNTAFVGGPFDNSDTGAAWVFTP